MSIPDSREIVIKNSRTNKNKLEITNKNEQQISEMII